MKQALRLAAAAAVAALAVVPAWLMRPAATQAEAASSQEASALPPVFASLPDFTLTDHEGRPWRRSMQKRPWVAGFFFTRCAGVCPAMTARMRGLAKKAPGLDIVSFSVDGRDDVEALKKYRRDWAASWTFAVGGKDEVAKLAREAFKLAAGPGTSAEEPILHSDRLVLVDAEGRIRGWFDPAEDGKLDALIEAARALGAFQAAPAPLS